MDVTVVFSRMIMLVLIMLVGYIATIKKVFNKYANANFAALITYVTVPALVISSVEGAGEFGTKADTLFVLLTATLMYFFSVILARFTPKLFRTDADTEGILQFLTVFTNNGFMGLPVVQAIFGTGALFYASLYGIPNNLLIYSYGIYLITKGSQKSKANWKAIAMNPGNLASVFAVFIFLFDIKLPALVMDTATSIGNITSPLAMIIIGSSLADIKILDAFKGMKIYALRHLPDACGPVVPVVGNEGLFDESDHAGHPRHHRSHAGPGHGGGTVHAIRRKHGLRDQIRLPVDNVVRHNDPVACLSAVLIFGGPIRKGWVFFIIRIRRSSVLES